eukprot:768117-Hanusia_phi.AAC.6
MVTAGNAGEEGIRESNREDREKFAASEGMAGRIVMDKSRVSSSRCPQPRKSLPRSVTNRLFPTVARVANTLPTSTEAIKDSDPRFPMTFHAPFASPASSSRGSVV